MADVLNVKTSEAEACIGTGTLIGAAKANPQPHGRAYAVVPEGTKLEYLEAPAFPPRRSGTVKLADVASFMEYWKRQSDLASYIYGSMVPAQFLAVLNEHHRTEGPDWRDHRALFTLAHSDEWITWTAQDGKPFQGNEAFSEFLEENLLDIASPEPAAFMDIALNMRVRQGQIFGKKVNLVNGNIALEYMNQVEANAGAAGTLVIPEQFEISIPVFKGLSEPRYIVAARFRYRLSNGALTLRYDLVRPAKVFEAAFKDLLNKIEREAKTTVLWGVPE